MNIVTSIETARKKGASDEKILLEIRKQNPEKEDFFIKAEHRGASASHILDEIIRQNKEEKIEEDATSIRRRKEEERRRKFLQKIEEKEKGEKEGFATPSSEAFTPSSVTPSPEQEEISPPLSPPQKPPEKEKQVNRILVIIVILTIFALSVAFLYRILFLTSPPDVEPVEIIIEVPIPRAPESLVEIDEEKDDIVRFPAINSNEHIIALRKAMEEMERGEITRIIIEDQREEEPRISDLEDFFRLFNIRSPEKFFEMIEKDFTLLIYTKEEKNRLAFVVKAKERDLDLEWSLMRPWERSIERDFRGLFAFLEIEVEDTSEELNNFIYERPGRSNPVIRYRSIPSDKNLLIVKDSTSVYSDTDNFIEIGRTSHEEKYEELKVEDGWYSIAINNTEGWIEEDAVIEVEPFGENVGLYYSIMEGRMEDKIVFSTSLESIKVIIDRL